MTLAHLVAGLIALALIAGFVYAVVVAAMAERARTPAELPPIIADDEQDRP